MVALISMYSGHNVFYVGVYIRSQQTKFRAFRIPFPWIFLPKLDARRLVWRETINLHAVSRLSMYAYTVYTCWFSFTTRLYWIDSALNCIFKRCADRSFPITLLLTACLYKYVSHENDHEHKHVCSKMMITLIFWHLSMYVHTSK